MPYSAKAHRLFEAAEHNPAIAKKYGIPQATAAKMASEGIKDKAKKTGKILRAK
jgi:hypothetical protein